MKPTIKILYVHHFDVHDLKGTYKSPIIGGWVQKPFYVMRTCGDASYKICFVNYNARSFIRTFNRNMII